MTQKAKAILQKMNLGRLFQSHSPQSAIEPVSTAGSDQGMAVLNEVNDLGQRQEEIIRESFPKITVY